MKVDKLFLLAACVLLACLFAPREEEASAADNSAGWNSIANGAGALTGGFNALGNGWMQIQALAGKTPAQSQAATMMNSMNAMAQISTSLGKALADEQACMKKAQADAAKFQIASAPMSVQDILGLSPSSIDCENYDNIIKSIKTELGRAGATGKELTCLVNLKSAVDQIADASKQTFAQLTQAANQSYDIQTQIIDSYQKMADGLDSQLKVYGEKLKGLRDAALSVNQALNAGSGKDASGNATSRGLARQIDDLKLARDQVANQWQQGILQDTWACFQSDATQICAANGQPDSPMHCMLNQMGNVAGGGPNQQVKNGSNASVLQQIFAVQYGILNRNTKATNLDANDIGAFLSYSSSQFAQLNSKMAAAFGRGNFMGSVSSSDLSTFFQAKMNDCYQNAAKNFKSSLSSKSGPYFASYNNVQQMEKDINAQATDILSRVTNQMNDVNSTITKTSNPLLSQFSANCQATSDPYQNVDCVTELNAILQAGLDGATHTVKLSNGGTYTATPSPITLSVQMLSLDQNGQPTTVPANPPVTCLGFNECTTRLQNSHDYAAQQVATYTQARTKFVTTANRNIDSLLSTSSAQFSQVSQFLTQTVAGVNKELSALGVQKNLQTTPIPGEQLVPNQGSGLYGMPQSMKAALAGKGSYTDLDLNSLDSARNNLMQFQQAVGSKLIVANVAKEACNPKASDYANVRKALGRCANKDTVCKSSSLSALADRMNILLLKSQSSPPSNSDFSSKSTPGKSFKKCIDDLEKAKNDLVDTCKAVKNFYAFLGAGSAAHALSDKINCDDKNTYSLINSTTLQGLGTNDLTIGNSQIDQFAKAKKAVDTHDNCYENLSDDLDIEMRSPAGCSDKTIDGAYDMNSIKNDYDHLQETCAAGQDPTAKIGDNASACSALDQALGLAKSCADNQRAADDKAATGSGESDAIDMPKAPSTLPGF